MPDLNLGLWMAGDLPPVTVEGMDVEKLTREQLEAHADARTRARNFAMARLMGTLAAPTLARGSLIGQHSGLPEFERGTEVNRGRRARHAGQTAVGFPIYKFGPMRSGWTNDYLAVAPNADILRFVDEVMNAHKLTNYNEALRALFDNAERTWTHNLFPHDGQIAVKPLANGTGSWFIPPDWQQNTFDDTHTHYLATGTALEEADLVAVAAHLREHGYGVTQANGGFGGRIETWINSAQVAAVKAHTSFVPANDPVVIDINKRYAAQIDLEVYLGYNTASRSYIREFDVVPAGYYLTFVTDQATPESVNGFAPLRRRIPSQGALQGLRRVSESKFPLVESFWEDFFGFGVANPISAVVARMHDTTYAVPTIGTPNL